MYRNATPKSRPDVDRQQIKSIIELANAGDESVVTELRGLLQRLPEIAGGGGGDPARETQRVLVAAIAGERILVREGLIRQLRQLRAEIGAPGQGPLERLLVDRVVLCWLYVSYADYQYAVAGDATLSYCEFLQRQQDRAQRRYLAAIRCLATIRRLALPIQLVTVAGKVETGHTGPACRRTVDVRHSNRP